MKFLVIALTGCLLACGSAPDEAVPTVPARIDWIDAVRGVLPPGAAITRTAHDVVPDGWISDRANGLLVEGRLGRDTFRIWILPPDWIGIRKPDPRRARPNYWDGILANDRATTITLSTEATIPDRLRGLGMQTPSLVNSGWDRAEKLWRGRFAEAEAEAARLISAHCSDRASRDEAAYSLIVLGVPAASVFRHTALEGTGHAQDFAISALGYFPDPASARVLATVLRDPAGTEHVRGRAAQSAEKLADPALGPALHDALRAVHDTDAVARVAGAIGRLRYIAAAPDVLRALDATPNPHYKAELAEVLASLRHLAAEPAIRRIIEDRFPRDLRFSAESEVQIRDRARRALFVLTGPWGNPADGLRLAIAGTGASLTIYIENVGDEVASFSAASSGHFVVDGVAQPRRLVGFDGMDSLHPNAVWTFEHELASTRGTHQVQYVTGRAASNTITVDVK